MNHNVQYKEYTIDDCQVRCVIPNFFGTVIIEIHNNNDRHIFVDLSQLRIKKDEWYYCVPWAVWAEPQGCRRLEVTALSKVDNLTYIEELAKEKNLV